MASSLIHLFDDTQKFPAKYFTEDNQLRVFDRVVTNAELLAIASTPLANVIAAPGSGQIIVPVVRLDMSYTHNGTSYAAGNNVILYYETSGDIIYTIPTADITSAASLYKGYGFTALVAKANEGISIKSLADFTGAAAPIRLTFIYRVIPTA